MALPSGGGAGKPSAPAAPFTYPVYTKSDFAAVPPTRPPASLAESLGTTASNQARTTVADQVAAIQQQQAADRASAAEVARQIGLASRAAAGFLGPGGYNLGGLAAKDYANAVAQTGGLASGYTGQLRDDLAGQTAAGQATLRSIPGNTQTLHDNGGSLANTLYGLQGSLPGQALAAEGLAATTTARLLPSQFLATGQNEALQALAAGRTDARALDPQITAARADLPKLTQQYLNDAINQNLKIAGANETARYHTAQIAAATAKAKADVVYKNAYLTHLQNGDTERVAHDKAIEAAGVTYHNAEISLGQGRLGVSQANAATSRYNANTSRINAQTSRTRALRTPAAPKGGLTQNEVSGLVDTWSQPATASQTLPVTGPDGKPLVGTDGAPVTSSQTVTTREPYTFTQAIHQLVGLKVPRADALQAVLSNPTFAAQAQTALTGATAGYAQRGTPLKQALAQIRRASGLPDSLILPALQQAYQAQAAAKRQGLARPGDLVPPNIFGR